MRLLYRATRDGFHTLNFHKKVDKQGPTLSIIKSEMNKVFGVYRTVSFNSSWSMESFEDPTAFIFSFEKKTIHVPFNYRSSTSKNHEDLLII